MELQAITTRRNAFRHCYITKTALKRYLWCHFLNDSLILYENEKHYWILESISNNVPANFCVFTRKNDFVNVSKSREFIFILRSRAQHDFPSSFSLVNLETESCKEVLFNTKKCANLIIYCSPLVCEPFTFSCAQEIFFKCVYK